jgi:phage terminase large subunit
METNEVAGSLDIAMPAKMAKLFEGKARYRAVFGGRGSGKTRSFALMAAVKAYNFAREGRVKKSCEQHSE